MTEILVGSWVALHSTVLIPFLQVKFAANKAYVQFTNHTEALRALRSVDAVLGNRFIKVFWANRPDDSQVFAPLPSIPFFVYAHWWLPFEI